MVSVAVLGASIFATEGRLIYFCSPNSPSLFIEVRIPSRLGDLRGSNRRKTHLLSIRKGSIVLATFVKSTLDPGAAGPFVYHGADPQNSIVATPTRIILPITK